MKLKSKKRKSKTLEKDIVLCECEGSLGYKASRVERGEEVVCKMLKDKQDECEHIRAKQIMRVNN